MSISRGPESETGYSPTENSQIPAHARKALLESLTTGFVNAQTPSDSQLTPKILSNNAQEHTNVLATLKTQLESCDRFDFAVAFITASGIETIVQLLLTLRDHNIQGRILTTTFNNFNDPEALAKLLEFPNIQVRVFEGNLHTKGYFFQKGQIQAMVIGSANLTQSALCQNKEWSVLLHSFDQGELYQTMRREYETLWQSPQAVDLTGQWIRDYARYRNSLQPQQAPRPLAPFSSQKFSHIHGYTVVNSGHSHGDASEVAVSYAPSGEASLAGTKRAYALLHTDREPENPPTPNAMQRSALASLEKIHGDQAERALLISATGTGKTYLSAFDVQTCKPKRVLFIAHRERILEASLQSFQRVLGDAYTYALYDPSKPADSQRATCLFAMVMGLSNHLEEFDSLAFDYIIVDETHRAGAATYQRVLSYFAPRFMLGMTATPERGDGYDIFKLFNHVIAFRITLQDALDQDMLTPFHYYGIADITINDQELDDVSLFSRLTSQERIRHVVSKIEDYSVNKSSRKGLIFCSRNAEAQTLSQEFNKLGYRTCALCGKDSDLRRNQAIAQLESGELEYLLSVDIFNEGIDIPAVNQIIMLRPTESAIVFVQQLGRGLRKAPHKESVLVLDFIGNYQNSYLIPIALSGDRTYNKDNLRRFVKEGSTAIPGCSTISFDRVAEMKIFEKLDAAQFSSTALIKDEYGSLKIMLGRIPTLVDFDNHGAIDPLLIFNKFGSYHAFLSRYEKDYTVTFTPVQERMLAYVSEKLANAKRRDELDILWALLSQPTCPADTGCPHPSLKRTQSVAACLTTEFVLSSQRKSYDKVRFVSPMAYCPKPDAAWPDGEMPNGEADWAAGFGRSPEYETALADPEFRRQMVDLLTFARDRNARDYPAEAQYADTPLVLYQKYTVEDVCRLLEWKDNQVALNVGGYKYDAGTNTFPVFITYAKDPQISATINYEDRFVSDHSLIALSKQPRTMDSPDITRLQNIQTNGMRVFLFVRKNKDDKDGGKEYYFLGTMRPTQRYQPVEVGGKPAVEIEYELDNPVRPDIFDYLTSTIE